MKKKMAKSNCKMVPQSLPKGGVCNLKIYITSLWASKSSDIHAIWTGWTLRDAKQMYNHKSPLTSKLWRGGDRQFSKKPTPEMGVRKHLIVLILELDMVRMCAQQLQFENLSYAQYMIHFSIFFGYPKTKKGGKKLLKIFKNWTAWSQTHAKPMYNHSWSQ